MRGWWLWLFSRRALHRKFAARGHRIAALERRAAAAEDRARLAIEALDAQRDMLAGIVSACRLETATNIIGLKMLQAGAPAKEVPGERAGRDTR